MMMMMKMMTTTTTTTTMTMMMMTILSHAENHPRSKWKEGTIGGEEGGRGGSLSPGRSGIRGPAHPFASQSKTPGSPLGGYLS